MHDVEGEPFFPDLVFLRCNIAVLGAASCRSMAVDNLREDPYTPKVPFGPAAHVFDAKVNGSMPGRHGKVVQDLLRTSMRERVAVQADATGSFKDNSSVIGVFGHFFLGEDTIIRAMLERSDCGIVFDHEPP